MPLPACGLGGGPSSGPCMGTYGPSDVGKGLWDVSMASGPVRAILAAGAIAAGIIFVIWAVGRVAGFWGGAKPPLKKPQGKPDAEFNSDFLNDETDGGYPDTVEWANGRWFGGDAPIGDADDDSEEDADEDDTPDEGQDAEPARREMTDDEYDQLETEYFRSKHE